MWLQRRSNGRDGSSAYCSSQRAADERRRYRMRCHHRPSYLFCIVLTPIAATAFSHVRHCLHGGGVAHGGLRRKRAKGDREREKRERAAQRLKEKKCVRDERADGEEWYRCALQAPRGEGCWRLLPPLPQKRPPRFASLAAAHSLLARGHSEDRCAFFSFHLSRSSRSFALRSLSSSAVSLLLCVAASAQRLIGSATADAPSAAGGGLTQREYALMFGALTETVREGIRREGFEGKAEQLRQACAREERGRQAHS